MGLPLRSPMANQVLEDEVLPGTENADQPTEEMSERHDHSGNYIGRVRIELCVKSFILQVYDVLARQTAGAQEIPRCGRSFELYTWTQRCVGPFVGNCP